MVSIILPVYNTGEILRNTLDSIIAQTYPDWELILVDDGSKDISASICDEYGIKDNRIKVYHKENGGICNARNYGLAKAKGEYIAFSDHDDLYEPVLLEKAILALEKAHSDIVYFRYKTVFDDGTTIESFKVSDYIFTDPKIENNFCRMYYGQVYETIWSKVYRKAFLENNGLFLDESFKFGGEDIDFNARVARFRPAITYLPDVCYTHFIRKSLSTSAKTHPENKRLALRHLEDYNQTIEDLYIQLTESNLEYYMCDYASLVHLYLAYIIGAGGSYKQFIKECKYLKSMNLTYKLKEEKSPRTHLFRKRIDAFITVALRYNCFGVIYFLFVGNSMFKRYRHG